MAEEKTEEKTGGVEDQKTDENTIVLPLRYTEPIFEHPHQVQKGEAIVTCKIVIHDPVKKVGEKVRCDGCGHTFSIEIEK